jgi:hypothetical protein
MRPPYSMHSSYSTLKTRQYFSPRRRYLPTGPHGVITQKTNVDILKAVKTSNFTYTMKTALPKSSNSYSLGLSNSALSSKEIETVFKKDIY